MYIHITANHGAPDWEEPEIEFEGTPDDALKHAVIIFPRATSFVFAIVIGDPAN